MDVLSVTLVKLNGATLDPSTYSFRSTGRLVLSLREAGFRPRYDEVEVTYTFGNLVIPEDLKQAALSLALDAYNYVNDGDQGEVRSEEIGSMKLTYASTAFSAVGKRHEGVIQSYRKVNL